MNTTRQQIKWLNALNNGYLIYAYKNDKGKLCFRIDSEPTLYLTLSMRSLVKRKLVKCEVGKFCKITQLGKDIIGV